MGGRKTVQGNYGLALPKVGWRCVVNLYSNTPQNLVILFRASLSSLGFQVFIPLRHAHELLFAQVVSVEYVQWFYRLPLN